jgi:hypothetical protein
VIDSPPVVAAAKSTRVIGEMDNGNAMGLPPAAEPEPDAADVPPLAVLARSTDEASVAEPQLLKALDLLAARLQERNPSASPAMIQHSIDDAIQAFSTVRIRLYLPILIERAVSKALDEDLR